MSNVPAEIVISPVLVFVALRVKVPSPDLVKAPEPVITPWIFDVVDDAVFIVPAPVIVNPLLESKVTPEVIIRPPPLKIILSASAEPGADPRLLSAEILKFPALRVVLPL